MKKNYLFALSFLLFNSILFAQPHEILCNLLDTNIKIENTSDIPTATNNGDGTITLIHPDQNITDIFSNHTIYEFYQTYPSANPEGELVKYYTIVFDNKDFINDLYDYTNPNIYLMDPVESTSIDTPFINSLNNKTFKLIKQCFESSESSAECPIDEDNIPEDVEVKLTFNFDAVNDILYLETDDITTCGNSFSAGFKGQTDDGLGSNTDTTLQLWSSQPGISNTTDYDQPCHIIENTVYSVLDIGCSDYNYGNIRLYQNAVGQLVITRHNMIFAQDFLTFEEDNLSIEDNTFKYIKPFKTTNNPFLQISNPENQSLNIEILSISGQIVLNEMPFENNSILLSDFANGLYFIKVKTLNNQQKIFKLLNN